MVDKEAVYFHLPAPAQTLALSLAGRQGEAKKYTPAFHSALHEYEARSYAATEHLREYVRAQRAITLERAARTRFYARVFDQMDASWYDLIDDHAFTQIPETTKQHVRQNPKDFHVRPPLQTDSRIRTSGTTGASIELLKDAPAVAHQWAVWWRYRRSHGLQVGDWCGLFAGRRVMREAQSAPYWRINRPGREVRFSTYHISAASAPAYVHEINRRQLSWLHGFASAIANLAALVISEDLRVTSPIKAITLGGENLRPWQADLIERAFGVRPLEHYGLSEQAANISMCPDGRMHVDEDFAFTEFLPDTSSNAQRIVGTALTMSAMPLLRYDTGDLASIDPKDNCSCGRNGRIVRSIDGRGDETIRLPDGRLIGSPEDAFRGNLGISEAQIVKRQDGSLMVRYVGQASISEARLERAVRDFVGNDIQLHFCRMSHIPRTSGGKLRLVVNET